MYKRIIKRILDFIIAGFILVLFAWLFLLISICLCIANKGIGIFFLQDRPGLYGRIFKVIKFKSMTDERDSNGNLLPGEERVTRIGRFIRKTSLDELPQLINVIKGEMSLVGPRPLMPRYLSLYSNEQARRHEVRPGITGWAQVNGRNSITWTEKFRYDVWYVDHCSLWLDIRILYMTIINVLNGRGINSGESKIGSVGFNGRN